MAQSSCLSQHRTSPFIRVNFNANIMETRCDIVFELDRGNDKTARTPAALETKSVESTSLFSHVISVHITTLKSSEPPSELHSQRIVREVSHHAPTSGCIDSVTTSHGNNIFITTNDLHLSLQHQPESVFHVYAGKRISSYQSRRPMS